MVKITAAPLITFVAAGLLVLPAYGAAQTPAPSGTSSSNGRAAAKTTTARWNEQDYKLGAGDKEVS